MAIERIPSHLAANPERGSVTFLSRSPMARTLGEQFFHIAMGPLAMAGASFRRGDVKQGLAELTGESLVGSVQRAIDTVASTSGVPVADIERLLPAGEMDALVARIAATQSDALRQWELHMTHASSLLEAIAKLTADGRPPEAGLCLSRIATKMRLEKALAAPLRDLAGLVDSWQAMLEQVRGSIDRGKVLEAAKRRREKRRQMAALGAVVTFVVVAAVAITVVKSRKRVDEMIARANPCEVELLGASDLRLASTTQDAAVASRRVACTNQREETRRAEERAHEEKQRRAKEEEERRERAAMCTSLGERLAQPGAAPLPPRTLALLGKDADFFARLVQGKLQGSDVTRDVTMLTCADGPASVAIAKAFTAAVVKSSSAWLSEHALSPTVLAMLTRGREGAPLFAREELERPIDKLALKALVSSEPEELGRARRACDALRALEVKVGLYCGALLSAREK